MEPTMAVKGELKELKEVNREGRQQEECSNYNSSPL